MPTINERTNKPQDRPMNIETTHSEACWYYLYLLFHHGTLIELQAAASVVLGHHRLVDVFRERLQ